MGNQRFAVRRDCRACDNAVLWNLWVRRKFRARLPGSSGPQGRHGAWRPPTFYRRRKMPDGFPVEPGKGVVESLRLPVQHEDSCFPGGDFPKDSSICLLPVLDHQPLAVRRKRTARRRRDPRARASGPAGRRIFPVSVSSSSRVSWSFTSLKVSANTLPSVPEETPVLGGPPKGNGTCRKAKPGFDAIPVGDYGRDPGLPGEPSVYFLAREPVPLPQRPVGGQF